MANVRQIAKQAGVSSATVSRVLNSHPSVSSEIRERVMAATHGSGYFPGSPRKAPTVIAFAYPGEPCLTSTFDAAIMAGMSKGMDEWGCDVLIMDMRRARLPHETYSQMFVRRGVRGAILRTNAQNRQMCETIAQEGFPAVVVGERFEDSSPVNYVGYESRTPSCEAVEHLIRLGHRRIAIAVNIYDDADHADRLAGYGDALKAAGIEMDKKLVFSVLASRQGGVQVIRRLAGLTDPPTAIYFTDPATAVGAVGEMGRIGLRIPADLSIVGFDDTDLRFSICPELSAVCQDARVIGAEALAGLVRMIDSPESGKRVRKSLRAWFEIHGSTGPLS